jgi:hypothetical protein
VRRALAVLAASGILLIVMAVPAAAHPGIEDPYVPAGQATTVALGVPSELPSSMVEIDVTLPHDFTLQRVDPVAGWQETTTPGQLRYFGGNVPQGGYAQFTFSGIFARKEVIEIPVITRAANGAEVNWDQPPTSRLPAAVMFPGYPLGASPIANAGLPQATNGSSFAPLLAVVAALGGGALVVCLVLRRRRHAGGASLPTRPPRTRPARTRPVRTRPPRVQPPRTTPPRVQPPAVSAVQEPASE